VHDAGNSLTELNELEYIKGKVYANIWLQEKIAIINPQTGQVEGWVNLSGIQDLKNQDPDNVFNGIAYARMRVAKWLKRVLSPPFGF
jgi:glutamine cyclotransferase